MTQANEALSADEHKFLAIAQQKSNRFVNLPDHLWMLFDKYAKANRMNLPQLMELVVNHLTYSLNPPNETIQSTTNPFPILEGDLEASHLPRQLVDICFDIVDMQTGNLRLHQANVYKMTKYDFFECLERLNRFMAKKGRRVTYLRSMKQPVKDANGETVFEYNDIEPKLSKKMMLLSNAHQVVIEVMANKINVTQNELYGVAVLSFCLQHVFIDPVNSIRDKERKEDLFPMPMAESIQQTMETVAHKPILKTGTYKWYGLDPNVYAKQSHEVKAEPVDQSLPIEEEPSPPSIPDAPIMFTEEQLQMMNRLHDVRKANEARMEELEKQAQEAFQQQQAKDSIDNIEERFAKEREAQILAEPALTASPNLLLDVLNIPAVTADEQQVGQYNSVAIQPIPDAHKPKSYGGLIIDEDDDFFNL